MRVVPTQGPLRDPSKDAVRARMLAARRALTDDARLAESRALCRHLPTVVRSPEHTVAGYAPLRTEPGLPGLVDALLAASRRLVLPVARASADGTPAPLRWAVLESSDALVAAPFGLREPPEPWLPPTALGEAQAVFVPALAVDRRGSRLGRGAGYYDRSLAFCNPSALLIAVVRDDELVDRLPDEPHDVPMTHALTPGFGLVALS